MDAQAIHAATLALDTHIDIRWPDPSDWLLLSGYALSYAEMREAATRWLAGPPPPAPLVFDSSPMAPHLDVYHWLTVVQELLVVAVMGAAT